jgi:hypothetical protein
MDVTDSWADTGFLKPDIWKLRRCALFRTAIPCHFEPVV